MGPVGPTAGRQTANQFALQHKKYQFGDPEAIGSKPAASRRPMAIGGGRRADGSWMAGL